MYLFYSKHWLLKRIKRKDITDDIIQYCIEMSAIMKDKHWSDAFNAIARIPPAGRSLKVVYKREGKGIKVVTAFWLD